MTDFEAAREQCGFPHPTTADMEAWNLLEKGEEQKEDTKYSLGLFGFDLTCILSFCHLQPDAENCPLIAARGLDGWAFGGVSQQAMNSGSGAYCFGFHYEDRSDLLVCVGGIYA